MGPRCCTREGERYPDIFSSGLTREDSKHLGHELGEASGQQCWESLCALVALRVWRKHWDSRRVKLLIRGDSVAMLTLVLRMKPSQSPGMGLIARELALDIAENVYQPDVATSHVSGIMNKMADQLSREAAPGGRDERPQALENVPETIVLPRKREWFRTLALLRKAGT